MNILSTTQGVGSAIAFAELLRSSLADALGQGFSVWSKYDGWEPWDGKSLFLAPENSSDDSIRLALQQYQFVQQSATVALPGNHPLLIVPVEGQEHGLFVIGLIGPHDETLVRKLADTIQLSVAQRCELENTAEALEEYATLVTSNFEELTWLRSVSSHLEICDVRNGLAQVAQATLPSLRPIIAAEALFLFGVSNSSVANSIPVKLGPLVFGDSDDPALEELARQAFAESESRARQQVIIWNSTHSYQPHQPNQGLRNYLIVPVIKGNDELGWIIGINKCGSAFDEPISQSSSWDKNEFEFGTGEAGLVSALAVLLATHERNVNLLQDKEKLLVGIIRALINAIDAKDKYTFGHSDRVALMSERIARQLGFSEKEAEQIHMSGLLHDIGKIGIPDSVLGKPGKLTDDEFAIIKTHPRVGFDILRNLEPLSCILPGVLHHHEAVDGSGYPDGLAGEMIPLQGRIIAVADSYDAMTSDRPYRRGMPTEKAEAILRSGMGTQWDSAVVEAFLAALPEIRAVILQEDDRPRAFFNATSVGEALEFSQSTITVSTSSNSFP